MIIFSVDIFVNRKMILVPEKCLFITLLFFISLVFCDYQEDSMSLYRFSTKTPYFFKPIANSNFYNEDLYTPRKIWAIYR